MNENWKIARNVHCILLVGDRICGWAGIHHHNVPGDVKREPWNETDGMISFTFLTFKHWAWNFNWIVHHTKSNWVVPVPVKNFTEPNERYDKFSHFEADKIFCQIFHFTFYLSIFFFLSFKKMSKEEKITSNDSNRALALAQLLLWINNMMNNSIFENTWQQQNEYRLTVVGFWVSGAKTKKMSQNRNALHPRAHQIDDIELKSISRTKNLRLTQCKIDKVWALSVFDINLVLWNDLFPHFVRLSPAFSFCYFFLTLLENGLVHPKRNRFTLEHSDREPKKCYSKTVWKFVLEKEKKKLL